MVAEELVRAFAVIAAERDLPPPATPEAVAECEAACGYAMPWLLNRLFTEVANGGFGPSSGIYGVRGHEWHSTDIFPDMTEAALEAVDDPEWSRRRWCLPLIDWGCAIMTLVDFRHPAGPLWGWDPHRCCLDHALFPLDQHLAAMLEESLTADYPGPFYAGYLADLATAGSECAPLRWKNGRLETTFTAADY